MPVVPKFWKPRLGDFKLKTSMGYIVRTIKINNINK